MTRLGREERPLFTSNFIVAETHALVLTRLGRYIAVQALALIDESATTVIRVKKRDEDRGREIIATHTDKDYSYTDATSFAVMERLRIGEAFTFDPRFAQFGFAVLG
jgi:predicted nucleic acid-binding protein